MTAGTDCDLLVVGLGPVGDVVAGLAARHGLRVVAIEREAAPYPLPRAAVFDHEIMRIFQALDVAARIEPLCRISERYQFVTAARDVLLDFEVGGISPVSGWRENYLLHQPAVERVLRARLDELGVDTRTGHAFAGLVQDADGVTASIDGPDGAYPIRARYLVACDGGRSPVREALGIALSDYAFDEPWLVIDATTDTPGDLPQTSMQICDPERPTTYLAMSPPRYRWEFMLKPGEDPAEIASDASVRALLAPWHCLDRIAIERRAVYRFHGVVAERWRQGRVLLAGDAAHQMPPFAGQGMCSGIRDAGNLVWKLAAVIRGDAEAALLDSYQAEREPHVRAIIETAIAMGRVVCILDPAAAAARDAGMLARRAAGEQDVSVAWPDLAGGCLTDTPQAGALFAQPIVDGRRLDDLLGPGAWLIGRDLPRDLPRDLHAVDAARHPALADWLDAHDAGAVLVRPDRHVFGSGRADALIAAWRSAMTGGPATAADSLLMETGR